MRKVKFQGFANSGPGSPALPGDIQELPDKEAEQLYKSGMCIYADIARSDLAKKPASVPQALEEEALPAVSTPTKGNPKRATN